MANPTSTMFSGKISSSAVCWKVRCMVSVVLALCKVCESNTREPADQNRQETPIFQTLHKTPAIFQAGVTAPRKALLNCGDYFMKTNVLCVISPCNLFLLLISFKTSPDITETTLFPSDTSNPSFVGLSKTAPLYPL